MFPKLREPANGLTHFIGIIFAIYALFTLLTRTNLPLTTTHIISFIPYGVAMFFLFLFSTLYHWLPLEGKKLEVLRKIDHIMIFIFIAASHTPICLITLKGAWGYTIVSIVWAIAIGGFFIKLFWLHAPRILYTAIYLGMGWIIVIAIFPLITRINSEAFIWIGLEALFYTVGSIVYAFKKPDPLPGILGFHEIFHIFILFGAYSHYYLVYHFV
jgi:hemolysin III